MKRIILDKLIEWKNQRDRKPLIIRGARQVGKTYLLRAFGQEYFTAVHYFNFERDESLSKIFANDLNPKRILQELSFYLNRSIDKDRDLVIFDEIQNVPRVLTSLKYFQEDLPELAICCAGSLLGVYLSDESFPVGKVEILNMFPMSFEEFLLGTGDARTWDFLKHLKADMEIPDIIHDHFWEQLKNYFVVGGLPEVVNTFAAHRDDLFKAFELVRKKQEDLLATYIADMAKHSGKQNAMHLERLWHSIPAQLAKEQNGSGKFKFKGIIPGTVRYSQLAGSIDWLSTAGLILKVPVVNSAGLPFSAHTKENGFKLYVFDVGLLGALSHLPAKTILDYDYGTYKGFFAENFVAQEFLCAGAGELHCWREGTAEIEFLREIKGDVLPLEVKSGWVTQSKSLKVFHQKYKPPYRTILSAHNLSFDHVHKVHRYPLYLAGRFPL